MERARASEVEWMALTLISESNLPHEWPYIGWVIRNRTDAAGYPQDVEGVVTMPFQFSAFNEWRSFGLPGMLKAARDKFTRPRRLYMQAFQCATEVLSVSPYSSPFGPKVLNYWSPCSMIPAGALPDWNWKILRTFNVSGVDAWRFEFAETVDPKHPFAGNATGWMNRNNFAESTTA